MTHIIKIVQEDLEGHRGSIPKAEVDLVLVCYQLIIDIAFIGVGKIYTTFETSVVYHQIPDQPNK